MNIENWRTLSLTKESSINSQCWSKHDPSHLLLRISMAVKENRILSADFSHIRKLYVQIVLLCFHLPEDLRLNHHYCTMVHCKIIHEQNENSLSLPIHLVKEPLPGKKTENAEAHHKREINLAPPSCLNNTFASRKSYDPHYNLLPLLPQLSHIKNYTRIDCPT